MTFELYGVVSTDHPGIEDEGLHRITWQDLAMVSRKSAGDPDPATHFAVVCALVEYGPVLPLRFGSVAEDEESVCETVLAPSAPQLRADLRRFDGLVEVHVCLKFAGHEAAWWPAQAGGMQLSLAACAHDSIRLPAGAHADERWAYLIPERELDFVRGKVAETASRPGLQAELVGPLPVYSFLGGRLQAPGGNTAWAGSRWGW